MPAGVPIQLANAKRPRPKNTSLLISILSEGFSCPPISTKNPEANPRHNNPAPVMVGEDGWLPPFPEYAQPPSCAWVALNFNKILENAMLIGIPWRLDTHNAKVAN